MSLDTQGIISAVVIAIYVPILFLAIRICSRYGLRESLRAWFLLVIFSLVRILGGALLVAAELVRPVMTGLYTGGYALEASGLSPLMLCTLGLLEIIMQGSEKEGSRRGHLFLLLHIFGLVALALMILGITSSAGSSSANTERRVGVLLFAALYIILVGITAMRWVHKSRLMKARKQLLVAVSAALPFLAVRVLYSVLSTFSSSSFSASTDPDNALAKFNMFSGEWQIYVAMEVVMEYVIVVNYTLAGNMLRLDQDYRPQENDDQYPLYQPEYPY